MGRCMGYARVLTSELELNLQIDALLSVGCAKALIFSDKVSSEKSV
jgi:hypothetical protein